MRTVRDIMSSDVIGVSPETTVRALAKILSEARISGVPVIDPRRQLLGVVSATDIIRLASESAPEAPQRTWLEALEGAVPGFFQDSDGYLGKWPRLTQEFIPRAFDETTVGDIMTSVPFTISAETSLPVLVQFLSERRIHRAIVTDSHGLAGIVTTFDVLRASAELFREGGDQAN